MRGILLVVGLGLWSLVAAGCSNENVPQQAQAPSVTRQSESASESDRSQLESQRAGGSEEATSPTIPKGLVQIAFVEPVGATVSWDVSGLGQFDSEPLAIPGRCNFNGSAMYRLKLTGLPGRPDVKLYPLLEIASTSRSTRDYLENSAVPVGFTQEDLHDLYGGDLQGAFPFLRAHAA